MWCVLRSGAHIPASIRSLIKLPSVRLFHSTTFHSSASPLGFQLSLPNLDTSHRLLAARVRRSRQRPPQSSCSPPCAGPRGTTTRERRLSHCLGRLRLLLAGWRSVLRNPSCGGLCRSYWPAVRTDGGTCGAVSRPALLILRGGMAQCAVRRGRGAAAFFTSRSYYKCVKLLRNHQSNSKFDLSILSPRAQANGERTGTAPARSRARPRRGSEAYI